MVISGTAENSLNVLTIVSSMLGSSLCPWPPPIVVNIVSSEGWSSSLSPSSNISIAFVRPSLSLKTSSMLRVCSMTAGRFSGEAILTGDGATFIGDEGLTGNRFSGWESFRGLLVGD